MRIASQMLLALSRHYIVIGICCALVASVSRSVAAEHEVEGVSTREARMAAVRSVPFQRISRKASNQIHDVVDKPSFYRRMPMQQIECDPQMFTFLVRRPEVMVNIWDIMGITKVSTRRLNPFSFFANDGVGTTCRCDLVYSDQSLHIYYGDGAYSGSMAPRKVTGRCVCILRSGKGVDSAGRAIVSGTMDVFLKLDNFGADLLTRTLGPFVGKTADHNFVETAKFVSQISQICKRSPLSAQGLAMKLDKVDGDVRRRFSELAAQISASAVSVQQGPVAPDVSVSASSERSNRHVADSRTVKSFNDVSISTANVMRLSDLDEVRSPPPGSDSTAAVKAELPSTFQFSDRRSPTIRPSKPNVYMRR